MSKLDARYAGAFPDWYDDRGRMTTFKDMIVIVHPEHPPHYWEDGKWFELKEEIDR
jgi:hypothetical protein